MSIVQPSIAPSTAICYWPLLLPDELLYSWLARLVAYNSLGDPRSYVELLFGTKDVIPGIDLPTRLATLYSRMGCFSPYDDADHLINAGTIYPYHRPFLSEERDEAVREILLNGRGTSLKTLLGRVANRFGANPPLRYCIACREEDIAHYGTPYWHRYHQLPGVICCATHRIALAPYVTPNILTDRQHFVLPPGRLNQPACRKASSTLQTCFALLSQDLLNASLPAVAPQRRKAVYEDAAKAMGFRTRRDRIDHDALAIAVRRHYSDFSGFTHRERLLSTPLHPVGWLRTLFDRPSRASHPICHILLIGFLFNSIDEFGRATADADKSSENIGLPDRSGGSQIPQYIDTQYDFALRNTELSCREVAQALKLSVTTVVSRRRALGIPVSERRKHVRSDRLAAITSALTEGLSPSSISRGQNVSLATVYRVRAQSPATLEAHIKCRHDHARNKHRKLWQQAASEQKRIGIQDIRTKAAASYMWLYRHDRAWLQESYKDMQHQYLRASTVNWNARDITLCERLEVLVAALKQRPDRPRISRTLILRDLGEAMVRANLALLPQLKVALKRSVESHQDFQLVRIDRAIEQLTSNGLPLQLWRIQRLSGIRRLTAEHRAYAQRKTAYTF